MGSVVLDCKIITRFSAKSCKLCKGLSVVYYLNVIHLVLVFLEQDEEKVPWHQLKPFFVERLAFKGSQEGMYSSLCAPRPICYGFFFLFLASTQ